MKGILSCIFSGIVGVIITILYQHYFAQPQTFTFTYNGKEMLVAESAYAELVEENEMLKNDLLSIREAQNTYSNQTNEEIDVTNIDNKQPT